MGWAGLGWAGLVGLDGAAWVGQAGLDGWQRFQKPSWLAELRSLTRSTLTGGRSCSKESRSHSKEPMDNYPRISVNIHEYPWISMDIHEYSWISMDIFEYPWISMYMHDERP